MDTFSLLKYLSKQNKIPFSEFGIAGLKDKHAITRQYLAIPVNYEINTKQEENFKIKFLGYIAKKLNLGDLKGNKFEITVRDIQKGELDGAIQKSRRMLHEGVPNYFDSQRFGSVIDKEFIAKHLIKKDYENAVKIYLTKFTKSEKRETKKEKTKILQNWKDIKKINVKNHSLRSIMEEYKRTDSWLSAYKRIPSNLREMFVSAYQSYLWNECVKELLKEIMGIKKLYSIPYNVGSLSFYKNLSEEELRKIPKTFQSISDELKPSGYEEKIVEKVLLKEGVKIEEFNIKEQTGNFFKTHSREVVLKSEDFEMSQPVLDEVNSRGNKKRFKITLKFSLQKGSYATMIIKGIFKK
jgi:tRNA pseudouridine13 synthase